MSRVLTVTRGGGRGWPALVAIALLAAFALFHEPLARARGGPAERLRLLLGKTPASRRIRSRPPLSGSPPTPVPMSRPPSRISKVSNSWPRTGSTW